MRDDWVVERWSVCCSLWGVQSQQIILRTSDTQDQFTFPTHLIFYPISFSTPYTHTHTHTHTHTRETDRQKRTLPGPDACYSEMSAVRPVWPAGQVTDSPSCVHAKGSCYPRRAGAVVWASSRRSVGLVCVILSGLLLASEVTLSSGSRAGGLILRVW